MSNLTSIEKLKLEELLEMGDGYVLDFSNATFQEFVLENSNIDIYDKKYNYRSGSKANRLRAFWKKEPNSVVGNLLASLLEYWEAKKSLNHQNINFEEQQLLDACYEISARLKKGITSKQSEDSLNAKRQFLQLRSELLAKFDEFAGLTSQNDKRRRGLLLETLLQRVFALYSIPTEKSFRRNEGGEQIDGAFKLDGWYYLVECKWTQKLTDIRQLDSLYGKIGRSGKQTLGLFLSMNGWSDNVCPLLKQNQDKSIILMDGYDLRCVLSEHANVNLQDLLLAKLAYLNFEGEPFYSVGQYMQRSQNP
jgi:hypothetical protein